MIEIKDLNYVIDENKILEHISFSIPEGGVTAIVGPNGVGKTTTLQLLSGILQSKNESIKQLSKEKKVIYIDLDYLVFDELTAREFLHLIASYNNKNDKDLQILLTEFEPLNIISFLDTKLKGLSLGQKQKLIIAVGFLSNMDVLILDEPFNGLDYKSECHLKTLLQQKKYPLTIIITTHNFVDIETYTDKCIVIKDKKSVVEIENNDEKIYKKILFRHLELEEY